MSSQYAAKPASQHAVPEAKICVSSWTQLTCGVASVQTPFGIVVGLKQQPGGSVGTGVGTGVGADVIGDTNGNTKLHGATMPVANGAA
jgi:hypothetical protein